MDNCRKMTTELRKLWLLYERVHYWFTTIATSLAMIYLNELFKPVSKVKNKQDATFLTQSLSSRTLSLKISY